MAYIKESPHLQESSQVYGSNMSSAKGDKLRIIFFIFFVLLNFPALYLADKPMLVWGVPLMYAYLFGVWLLLILAMMLMMLNRKS
jgi:hypothetical protein